MPSTCNGGGENIPDIKTIKTRSFHEIVCRKNTHEGLKSKKHGNDKEIFIGRDLAWSDFEIF